MPIRPEPRYFYPIDWPQISHWVRFTATSGRCANGIICCTVGLNTAGGSG